jgi:hypothetical protein
MSQHTVLVVIVWVCVVFWIGLFLDAFIRHTIRGRRKRNTECIKTEAIEKPPIENSLCPKV